MSATNQFYRRAMMMGELPFPVISQAFMRSQIRADHATGLFGALTLPTNLRIIIDANPVATATLTSTAINTIVTDINTALGANGFARNEGGYLAIVSSTNGEGSRVQLEASTVGDGHHELGFPVGAVDPMATAYNGMNASAPPYPTTPWNTSGARALQRSEELTSEAFNRGFYQLASNDDILGQRIFRSLPFPQVIEVDTGVAPWNAYILVDGSGNVTQIDLSSINSVAAGELENSIYTTTTLSQDSSLREISEYFKVHDYRGIEMLNGGDPVMVSAVTRGQKAPGAPVFADEDAVPGPKVPDVAVWLPVDNGNVLGATGFQKLAATPIDAILYRSALRIDGVNFSTLGVVAGDICVISGAAVNIPFNHDGTYRVDEVLDQETVLLTKSDGEACELNPDAGGAFGSAQFLAGEYSDEVWLSFDPPIPAAHTNFRLVVGVQKSLADLTYDDILRMAIRTSSDIEDMVQTEILNIKGPLAYTTDDFTALPFEHDFGIYSYAGLATPSLERLWDAQTLGDAYAGPGLAGGGGFYTEVSHRPARWMNRSTGTGPGTLIRSGVAMIVGANNVCTDPAGQFTLADVGRTLMFTTAAAAIPQYSTHKIIHYTSLSTIVVEPGLDVDALTAGSPYAWSIYEDRQDDLPAVHRSHAVPRSRGYGRMGFMHTADHLTASREWGESFLSLQGATTHGQTGAALHNVPVTFAGGDEYALIAGFDPSDTYNIHGFEQAGDTGIHPGGYVRLYEAGPNDGWYRIVQSLAGSVRLADIDDASVYPVLTIGSGKARFYYANFAVGMPYIGSQLFEDFTEMPTSVATPGVVNVGWRGEPALGGIWGWVNSNSWKHLTLGVDDYARGAFLTAITANPAVGLNTFHDGADNTYASPWRGGYAGKFVADTSAMDMRGGLARGFTGWGALVGQLGRDPALVLLSEEGLAGIDYSIDTYASWTNFRSVANLIGIANQDTSQLQGGFAEFAGAVYQRHGNWANNDSTDRHYGGFYSERSIAAYSTIYPFAMSGFTGSAAVGWRYYEQDLNAELRARARLGHPGQILPLVTGTTLVVDNITAPDGTGVASRSTEDSGFIEWVAATDDLKLHAPFDRYIGCQAKVTLSGSGNNGTYTIINVIPTAGSNILSRKVEVTGRLPLALEATGTARVVILGSRWHYGYVDLAQFMLIGTESETDTGGGAARDIFETPALGSWGADLNLLIEEKLLSNPINPVEPAGDPANWNWWRTMRVMRGFPSIMDVQYGTGLGALRSLVGATDWISTDPFLNNEWNGFYDVQTAISGGAFEGASLGAGRNRTNLGNAEWGWYSTAAYGGSGPSVATDLSSDPPAMTLEMFSAIGATNITAGSILMRSRTFGPINLNHYEITVAMEIELLLLAGALAGDQTVTVTAYTEAGVSLGSDTNNITIGAATALQEFVISGDGLREGAVDAYDQMINWYFEVTFSAVVVNPDQIQYRFYKIVAYSDRKTAVFDGNFVSTGPVIAPGFRTPVPVHDWHAVGPNEADLFVPSGYAIETPIIHDGVYTGSLKYPVDPPGMAIIRHAYDDGVLKEYFAAVEGADLVDFKKGVDYSAVRFLTPLTDPVNFNDPTPGNLVDGVTVPWSPPARIGFTVPISPPHGSMLTDLSLSMSFKPAYGVNAWGPPIVQSAIWGIWYDRDPFENGTDRAGVRVRLVRQHLFNDIDAANRRVGAEFTSEAASLSAGAHADVYSRGADGWQTAGNQEMGFYEVLYATYIHLDGAIVEIDPVVATSPNVQGHDECGLGVVGAATKNKVHRAMGEEYFTNRKYFFLTERGGGDPSVAVPHPGIPGGTVYPEKFVVDTRQYSYSVIIDAWGGPITGYDPAQFQPVPPVDDHAEPDMNKVPWLMDGHFQPGLAGTFPSKPQFVPPWARMHLIEPTDAVLPSYVKPWDFYVEASTPVMKFRGLRYGFEWTRLQPG